MPAVRFFSLAVRVAAYSGVMSVRVQNEVDSSTDHVSGERQKEVPISELSSFFDMK